MLQFQKGRLVQTKIFDKNEWLCLFFLGYVVAEILKHRVYQLTKSRG
jgi:hypothetical protein